MSDGDNNMLAVRVTALEENYLREQEERAARQRERDQHDKATDQKLDRIESAMQKGFSDLRVKLFGNGTVEGSVCYELAQIKRDLPRLIAELDKKFSEKCADLDKRINKLAGTDDWRRDFIYGLIRTIAGSVISSITVAIILMKILRSKGSP
jgi:hypothetical protein